jgi:hypothetical protein
VGKEASRLLQTWAPQNPAGRGASPSVRLAQQLRLYALVSDESEAVIDWYPSREAAYTALRECLADDPDWDDVLFVWPFDFDFNPN